MSDTPYDSLEVEFAPFDPRKHRAVREEVRAERDFGGARQEWRPHAQLPEPEPEAGFQFRWVRNGMQNMADAKNVAQKFAEGWEPVSAASQPRIASMLGRHGVNTDGNIEIGGLLLCKMPLETVRARQHYYDQMSARQLQAVDNQYLRDNNRKMPKLAPERHTSISNRAV